MTATGRSRTERRSEPIEVVYVMHEVGGAWRVTDVVTGGASLLNGYRTAWRGFVRTGGVDHLLARMRATGAAATATN